MMSSSTHPITILSDSNVEDAFSSTNTPDYTPASPDYFPSSPGNTPVKNVEGDDEISNLVDLHMGMFGGGWKWQDLQGLLWLDHHKSMLTTR
ncbi:hypothetical protein Tco_0664442 [Tanacetum coccineum]